MQGHSVSRPQTISHANVLRRKASIGRHPRLRVVCAVILALFVALPAPPAPADGPISVLTRSYNNSRTGANLSETELNTANVNVTHFGRLFSHSVDGQIYAQPLYVPSVSIPGKGTHNVVYVATQHNSVYAFDADGLDVSAPLWQVNLGTPVPLPSPDVGPGDYVDILIEVGITGTPVIDPSTGTLYVVAITREPIPQNCPCQYRHRLHALNIHTGAEKFGGPTVIASPATGRTGGASPSPTFDSTHQLQRPGLLLSNGVVYIAFGSYGDWQPYHGWIFGYNAQTLQQASFFNTTPTGYEGAIWQSGQGLSVDEGGYIYAVTGNGDYDVSLGGSNYGDSMLKLSPPAAGPGTLTVADWFTPYNQEDWMIIDNDFGSTGAVLIPGTHLLLGAGKSGEFFLVNRDAMGHYNGPHGPDLIVQRFQAAAFLIYGSPVYWNSPNGPRVYVWAAADVLREFSFDGSQFQTTPVAIGSWFLDGIEPGGILSVSANGSTAGSGILWASHPTITADHQTAPGVLRAYNAFDVGVELWNSEQNPSRDRVGNFAKFCPPTIAAGKVYLATFSNELVVYGLLAPKIITQPADALILVGQATALTVVATGPAPLNYQWYQGTSGDTSQPVGTNDPRLITPPLTANTSYWVRVSNASGQADSHTAVVTVANEVFRTYMPLILAQ
jgi:hypothetical protein